jgi:hypothetical protein
MTFLTPPAARSGRAGNRETTKPHPARPWIVHRGQRAYFIKKHYLKMQHTKAQGHEQEILK